MTEEKETVGPETDAEESVTEASDTSQENLGLESGSEEAEPEGNEEEETDERGVPLKNKIKELERKLERQAAQNELLMRQLQTKPEPKPKEGAEAAAFKELAIAEIAESMNVDEKTAEAIVATVENRIDRRLYTAEQEAKKNQQWQQEKAKKRWESIVEFNETFCEDDKILKEVQTPSGVRKIWNEESPLLKQAREVLRKNPSLNQREGGEVLALMQAKLELSGKSKGGSPSAVDKASTMLGKGGRRSGSGGIKRDGKFYRELSDEEYSTLKPEEQSDYDKWEVTTRFTRASR